MVDRPTSWEVLWEEAHEYADNHPGMTVPEAAKLLQVRKLADARRPKPEWFLPDTAPVYDDTLTREIEL